MSASGNWRIGEDGKLVVKKVTAEIGEFKKGVTIYDKQGEAGCVFVESVHSGAVNVLPGGCELSNMGNATETATNTEEATPSTQ